MHICLVTSVHDSQKMKDADIIQSHHALSFIATCTLALSTLPCSGEAFILILKDCSDRQYGREKQQDAHCELALSVFC